MSTLNVNQRRHVQSTFAHVDSLLQAAEKLAREELSPFARERADFAADEAGLLQASISLARARMLAALDRLGLPRPVASASAKWSAQTSLLFAANALAELGPSDLRGYGPVDPDTASELEALAADIRGVLERARLQLREQEAGGFADQVAAIDGPVGEVLRTVEQISRTHALAEIRPLLAAAVERATSILFDVGVFGRVSAGKSSLIDALVGENVLPVGATPVTAVPVRLSRGPHRVTLRLLDGSTREIPLPELPQFATEEFNPDNRAGVGSIDITVPGVPQGLRLLDTPGVGSTRSSGAAQAFAWLPRCDLGIVLIAAGSPVGREELALATGLCRAGIRCVVLLSKADLLADDERERVLAYIARELVAVSGTQGAAGDDEVSSVEVLAVSTLVGQEGTLDTLRRMLLVPLGRDHARAARRALSLRLNRLVAATGEALSRRRGESSNGDPSRATSDDALRVERARTAARTRVRDAADRTSSMGPMLLDQATHAVVEAWTHETDAGDTVRGSLLTFAGDQLAHFRGIVDAVRDTAGTPTDSRRRAPPIFNLELLEALPALAPPGFAMRLMASSIARHKLEALAAPLNTAVQEYASRLYRWADASLDDVTSSSDDVAREFGAASAAGGAVASPELAALRPALARIMREGAE